MQLINPATFIRVISLKNRNLPLICVIFLAAAFVGLLAVSYNEVFLIGTKFARQNFIESPWLVFLTTPLFFLLSSWLCRRYAPNAAGSGPEHVISALKKLGDAEKQHEGISEFLSLRILIIKIISSTICIAGGGALGREGPVVQIAASIFVLVTQKIKKIIPSFDLRAWIIAGSAAGVAAAFNTPLAGIVFAIEELSQFHLDQKFFSFKKKVFFAVIVAGVTAQFITGSYVLFEFSIMHFKWQIQMVATLVMVALVCGFTAWLLKTIANITTRWRNSVTGNGWYFFPVICGLIVATVSYLVGINSFGAGIYTINDAFLSSTQVITFKDSLGRFINIIATYASGCAGGLLLPALALGAGVGSIGSLILPMEDSRILIATGMAAFLGALLNAPLTAAVLVLEVTNQRELILPLFLSTFAASWIFQKCNDSRASKYLNSRFNSNLVM